MTRYSKHIGGNGHWATLATSMIQEVPKTDLWPLLKIKANFGM